MKLKKFFSSSQRLPKVLLYLVIGLIFTAGIGVLAYEAIDIINLQQSVVKYEESLEQRTAEINRQLQESDKIKVGEVNQARQSLEELSNISSELESGDRSPFQPRLDKTEVREVREEPKQRVRKSNKNILGLEIVGLVTNPQIKLAILKSEGGNNQTVREGEIINNWLIKEITGQAIVITPTTENSFSASEGTDKEFRIKIGG